jgi:POT family proton-dependent oligopeptide transporter
VIFFWAAFEQAGASLTYFAEEQTDRTLFGREVPASAFQSINAVAIVIFAPLFVWIWGFLGKRNMEPASPFKQALGLFLLAIGYLVIAFGVKGIDPSTKVNMGWLVGLYTIHTFGELCLSPIGLSMVNKLSPARLASLLMGVWFLSTASANKFAGILSALYPEEVKLEKSYTEFTNQSVFDSLATCAELDSNVFKADPKSFIVIKTGKLTTVKSKVGGEDAKDSILNVAFEQEKLEQVLQNESEDNATVQEVSIHKREAISVFQLKVIKSNNKYLDRAILIDNGKKLLTHDSIDVVENKISKKVERMQVWNLNPQKPVFAGMQISTLYDFFMIFVFMAGAASVFLFFLSKKLLKLMNGVR